MFEVQDSRRRAYPWSDQSIALDRSTLPRPLRSERMVEIEVSGVADHILGTMRSQVFREDVERRPFTIRDADGKVIDTDLGGYRIGDRVGNSGLEQVFEDHLRGERGQIRRRLDTNESTRTEPRPGDDLHLTLDVALQARIQAILSHEFGLTVVQPYHHNTVLPDGKPLNAAAVVVEVATGEIRAMVTMPTLADGRAMSDLERSIHRPGYNRAIEAIYPPGSIMKPLVLAAAVTSGVHRLDQPIHCTGHYFPHNEHVARCWIYREKWGFQTHGDLRAEEAIARSCNIFFYTLADRLGVEALLDWYRGFGLGRRLEIGLAESQLDEDGDSIVIGEVAGDLPSEADLALMREQGTALFNTIILGIGQGPVTWTPVHAANAYATLARGGAVRDATLIAEQDQPHERSSRADLDLEPAAVRAALEGLHQSVSEPHGTGQHITYEPGDQEPIFNASGVTVWGKTGTAQATAADLDGDGTFSESERNLDHSWFVGLVGPDDTNRPMFAISVLVEHGGSGGRCAGPIANQIIHALQEEGYLPRPALADGGGAR
jgi:penicillin-binding protein 2